MNGQFQPIMLLLPSGLLSVLQASLRADSYATWKRECCCCLTLLHRPQPCMFILLASMHQAKLLLKVTCMKCGIVVLRIKMNLTKTKLAICTYKMQGRILPYETISIKWNKIRYEQKQLNKTINIGSKTTGDKIKTSILLPFLNTIYLMLDLFIVEPLVQWTLTIEKSKSSTFCPTTDKILQLSIYA